MKLWIGFSVSKAVLCSQLNCMSGVNRAFSLSTNIYYQSANDMSKSEQERSKSHFIYSSLKRPTVYPPCRSANKQQKLGNQPSLNPQIYISQQQIGFLNLIVLSTFGFEGFFYRGLPFPWSFFYFYFWMPGGYRPHKSMNTHLEGRRQGWGSWSGRGSNLQPLAQRNKQMVFHICCTLC